MSVDRELPSTAFTLWLCGVSVDRELPSTAFTLWLCVGCLWTENFPQQPLLSGCVGGVCGQRTSLNSLYSLAVWGVSVDRELQSTAFTLAVWGVSVDRELPSTAFTLWLCVGCLYTENFPQQPSLSGCVGGVCIQRTSLNSLYSLAVWGVSVYRELPSTAFTLWLCGGCLWTENFPQQPLLSGCVGGVCIQRTSLNSLYSLAVWGQRVLGRQSKYKGIMCMQLGSSDRCLRTENFIQQPLVSCCVVERVLGRQAKLIMCAYLQIFQNIFWESIVHFWNVALTLVIIGVFHGTTYFFHAHDKRSVFNSHCATQTCYMGC